MKFFTALALCAAPLAMAKAVHNVYPAKRDPMLAPRKPQSAALVAELQALGLSGLGLSANAATEVIIIWVNPGAGAATTTVNNPMGAGAAGATAAPLASGAAAAAGAAVTHQVTVGGNAGLAYTPSQLTAAVGDMVVFTFMSANHTVTQSAFASPCVAMAGGMDSGFQPNANNSVNPPPQVAMQVMVDTPLCKSRAVNEDLRNPFANKFKGFYCKQKGHCGKGMTFSINPTAAKTQAMFQSMAIAQNGTGMATAITGGAAGAAPAASNGTAAASGSGTTAGTGGATTGTGSIQGGQCQCAVTCTAGSLPAANAQGLGAFGGMTGTSLSFDAAYS